MICILPVDRQNFHSASTAGTECGTIGFTFGTGFFVLHTDLFSAAVIVNGVVLTGGDIACDTGILAALFCTHFLCSFPGLRILVFSKDMIFIRRTYGPLYNWRSAPFSFCQ